MIATITQGTCEVASIFRTVRKGESSALDPIKESPPRTRRKFDLTFNREAVGNWLSSGKSAAVVAKELGLTEGLLFAWPKLLPPDAAGGGERRRGCRYSAVQDLRSELDAARQEIRHEHEQRDILKKTSGILSEPSWNATNGATR